MPSVAPIDLLIVEEWYCPNCGRTEQIKTMKSPHVRMHICPKIEGGMTAPMIKQGIKAHVYAVMRQDYVGKERVQLSPTGKPVMTIVTVRDDGQDAIVFVPQARAEGKASDYRR